jgi:hypothetical protein
MHKRRSMTYWFTEICDSQCITHFATIFITDWAEASIAVSVKYNLFLSIWRYRHDTAKRLKGRCLSQETLFHTQEDGRERVKDSNPPLLCTWGAMGAAPHHKMSTMKVH